jgi:hypothetical protein
MLTRYLRALLVLVVLAIGIWFIWPEPGESFLPARTASPASAPSAVPAPRAPIAFNPAINPSPARTAKIPPRSDEPRSTLADRLNTPSIDIHSDLRLVSDILDTFRSNFPRDGNPVGTNSEITAALTGKNKLRLALIPPDHPAINRDGELCDRWGTPFFFHSESAAKMEIRSAGPDKKMWTEDDVVLSP